MGREELTSSLLLLGCSVISRAHGVDFIRVSNGMIVHSCDKTCSVYAPFPLTRHKWTFVGSPEEVLEVVSTYIDRENGR